MGGSIVPRETQSTPSSPYTPTFGLSINKPRSHDETLLHKSQNARVTKQSYHTGHKLPYATRDTRRRAQLQEAEVRAQERYRKEQQASDEEYIKKYACRNEALQHGVHMIDVENGDVPFKLCADFASTEYRYSHLPSMNPDLVLPSVENLVDLTDADNVAGDGASSADVNNHVSRDLGASNDAAGPSNGNASDRTSESRTERALSPLFDTPVPHDKFLNEYELPAIVPDEADPATPLFGQAGLFREPLWDETEGCWRAPEPGMTQERADVEEILCVIEYVNKHSEAYQSE